MWLIDTDSPAQPGAPGRTAVARSIDDGRQLGSVTIEAGTTQASIDIDVTTPHDQGLTADLFLTGLELARASGSIGASWWARGDVDDLTTAAEAAGMSTTRSLWQMRTPLPVSQTTDLQTRRFEPGVDDNAWLAVNNAAFAWHPEQSGWTTAELHQRVGEPWFDPAGFLLHEIDGQLAAFCWTKVHADLDPPVGEIYVIAVDPAFHGRGLGKQMTLAGLQWLAGRGLTTAMLYVESDNAAAVTMYEHLGFTVHRVDRQYRVALAPESQDIP